ncbi:SDR family oxidoreductase [Actinomycetospora soli]|uniref:SDR family oxidoreductase n=1 Tax=Actinomycetospora soli TaxID=2893887 RepID=UPI001E3809A9|nr:SDR family oxidoreductase [Actinomycetospora soli]MCD2191705.1 SDR family oxidoreductase [Actinomycetospora soli]
MTNVADKVVAITGASSGLGEATARRLADQGAKVFLGARREENLKRIADDIGDDAAYRTLDVTDRDDVQSFVDAAEKQFGRVDVLLANAGLMPLSPLEAAKVDEWEQMIDVNLKGVLYGIAAVLPKFRAQGGGHVISLASVAAHTVFANSAVYSATKFGVWAVMEGLRQEVGEDIRATVISPGAVSTELTSKITHADSAESAEDLYSVAIDADVVARAISYAIDQPADTDINEIVLRPTAQSL